MEIKLKFEHIQLEILKHYVFGYLKVLIKSISEVGTSEGCGNHTILGFIMLNLFLIAYNFDYG